MTREEILIDIQSQFFNTKGVRTDIYNIEGNGVYIVHENAEFLPHNFIASLPEHLLNLGQKITVNF